MLETAGAISESKGRFHPVRNRRFVTRRFAPTRDDP